MLKFLIIVFLSLPIIADSSFDTIPDIKIDNINKYNLGKKLFHDKNLSKDKTISCSSCHNLNLYGVDNKEVYTGINNIKGDLNSPTIYNTRFNIAQDNAGKAKTIKERAKFSFLSKSEMSGNMSKLIQYIYSNKILYDSFISVYGNISEKTIFDSISYFVENLLTPNSKFDRYLKGDKTILSVSEIEGFHLFKKYGCVSCHNGINIGGNMYQKLGVFSEDSHLDDTNIGRYSVTKKDSDKNVFKVPSLRNIANTSPYSHDGSISDLHTMIKRMAKLQLGVVIAPNDVKKIELFLMTLSGDINEY